MAIDVVARPADGWLTLVHDDQELDVRGIVVEGDGTLLARGGRGIRYIGKLADSMILDVSRCDRAAVVRMHGARVAETVRVLLTNRVDQFGRQ